eukprot:9198918-Alexandrium_andersonii.AAC.1
MHSSRLVARPLKRLEENGPHVCCGPPPSLGTELHCCSDAYPHDATASSMQPVSGRAPNRSRAYEHAK